MTQPQYELQFAPKAIPTLRKLDYAAVRRIRERLSFPAAAPYR